MKRVKKLDMPPLRLQASQKLSPRTRLKELSILSILIISSLAASGAGYQADGATNNKSTPTNSTNKQMMVKNVRYDLQSTNPLDQHTRLSSSKRAEDLDQSSSSSRAQLLDAPSTLPSITSVHQVWTSASSGRLDELSPEIISKLRSDVPFLAAYALRPRLVGGSHRLMEPERHQHQQSPASLKSLMNGQSLATIQLETGASSPQAATESLVPKLGDFSEFRVETSSTSKSEHHHKRKTSLKRKESRGNDDGGDDDDDGGQLRMKKRVLAEASQLVRKQQRRRYNNGGGSKSASSDKRARKTSKSTPKNKNKRGSSISSKASRNGSRLRRKGALMRIQARAGRLRAKMNRRNLQHHMSIIKHGRYQQQEPSNLDSKGDGGRDVSPSGSDGSTKGGDSSGVKGGSNSRASGIKPFYSKAVPDGKKPGGHEDDDVEGDDYNGRPDEDTREETTPVPESATSKTTGGSDSESAQTDKTTINEVDGDVELDNLPEPKRVGDPDVDEKEGDTVTVMPKFDGVDDDPEIPDDYEDTTATTTSDQDQGKLGQPGEAPDDVQREPEGRDDVAEEPRTRRVNRERQNEAASGDDGTSNVSSGGIGAAVGNGNAKGSTTTTSVPGKGDENDEDDDSATSTTGGGKKVMGDKVESGVEFANEDRNDADGDRKSMSLGGGEDDNNDDDDLPRKMGTSKGGSGRHSPEARDFESMKEEKSSGRRVAAGSDDENGGGGKVADDSTSEDNYAGSPKTTPRPSLERDPDLDYRDDSEESGRKSSEGSRKSGGHAGGESSEGEDKMKKGHKSGGRENCDDGSYNHDNHEHHHSHHDSIKWLQDAIPGEPNQDYPILSRANVTNFRCSDHEYPGYYADVEARCQVFHICQADGRQDSFLCPNGTIFSQKHYVCVWWNSFNCEDAPKYYDLNALLYKSASGNKNYHGAPDLRPIDGDRIGGSSGMRANDGARMIGGGASVDEETSIDSLIRDMRRDKAGSRPINEAVDGSGAHSEGGHRRRTMGSMNSVEDEATIQRKSLDDVDESSGLVGNSAARSRLRANNGEPRRKRRASVRQAPAKLNSRRVSRNSRRRRIRHGIKPKRRA